MQKILKLQNSGQPLDWQTSPLLYQKPFKPDVLDIFRIASMREIRIYHSFFMKCLLDKENPETSKFRSHPLIDKHHLFFIKNHPNQIFWILLESPWWRKSEYTIHAWFQALVDAKYFKLQNSGHLHWLTNITSSSPKTIQTRCSRYCYNRVDEGNQKIPFTLD